jgi:rhodanese-related sulfurtransferase
MWLSDGLLDSSRGGDLLMIETTIPPIPEVGPTEARRLFRLGALALDVREPDEFASGHVVGARLIPLGQLSPRLRELPRDRDIIVVCRSGRRSGEAVRLLRQAGLDRALNLSSGMLAWIEAGLPVEG